MVATHSVMAVDPQNKKEEEGDGEMGIFLQPVKNLETYTVHLNN